MKIFLFWYESTGKTGKKTVDLFLISFLIPEISALKEVQNGTRSGSPKYGLSSNFGENGEICDVNRFACQEVNYEIDYILLITHNDRMKLCRQMGHNKRQFKE